jgi:hypothetical protein
MEKNKFSGWFEKKSQVNWLPKYWDITCVTDFTCFQRTEAHPEKQRKSNMAPDRSHESAQDECQYQLF